MVRRSPQSRRLIAWLGLATLLLGVLLWWRHEEVAPPDARDEGAIPQAGPILRGRRLPARKATARDPESQPADAGIQREPMGPLGGVVVDAATGRPVPDVKVTALEGGPPWGRPGAQRLGRVFGQATTGADGRFVVGGVPHEPRNALRLVRVEASGFRTLWKLAPPPGINGDLVIRLVPGGVLEGTVTTPRGAPAAGAVVVVVFEGRTDRDPSQCEACVELPARFSDSRVPEPTLPVAEDAWGALTATTDAAGHFEVEGLGLGERYSLGARAAGHAHSASVHGVCLTSEVRRQRIDLVLREPCRLAVRCHDVEGRPWPGLLVEIRHLRGSVPPLVTAETGADGLAHFDAIPPGDLQVLAYESGGGSRSWKRVRAPAGPLEVTLALEAEWPGPTPPPADEPPTSPRTPVAPRAPTLVARLAVPEGVSPPAFVQLWASTRGWRRRWAPDADGTMHVEWDLEPLRFTFGVQAPGFLPLTRDVVRESGANSDLGTLTLDPGETLRGFVRAPDGTPLPGVAVEISYPARDMGSTASFQERKYRRADAHVRERESEDAFVRECATAADGSFLQAGLPRERVSIEMRDPRFLPFHTIAGPLPGLTPLELVVHPGAVVEVWVVDVDGHPATRRYVTIWRDDEDGDPAAYGLTNVEGVFAARLEAGAYRIEFGTRKKHRKHHIIQILDLADGDRRRIRATAP